MKTILPRFTGVIHRHLGKQVIQRRKRVTAFESPAMPSPRLGYSGTGEPLVWRGEPGAAPPPPEPSYEMLARLRERAAQQTDRRAPVGNSASTDAEMSATQPPLQAARQEYTVPSQDKQPLKRTAVEGEAIHTVIPGEPDQTHSSRSAVGEPETKDSALPDASQEPEDKLSRASQSFPPAEQRKLRSSSTVELAPARTGQPADSPVQQSGARQVQRETMRNPLDDAVGAAPVEADNDPDSSGDRLTETTKGSVPADVRVSVEMSGDLLPKGMPEERSIPLRKRVGISEPAPVVAVPIQRTALSNDTRSPNSLTSKQTTGQVSGKMQRDVPEKDANRIQPMPSPEPELPHPAAQELPRAIPEPSLADRTAPQVAQLLPETEQARPPYDAMQVENTRAPQLADLSMREPAADSGQGKSSFDSPAGPASFALARSLDNISHISAPLIHTRPIGAVARFQRRFAGARPISNDQPVRQSAASKIRGALLTGAQRSRPALPEESQTEIPPAPESSPIETAAANEEQNSLESSIQRFGWQSPSASLQRDLDDAAVSEPAPFQGAVAHATDWQTASAKDSHRSEIYRAMPAGHRADVQRETVAQEMQPPAERSNDMTGMPIERKPETPATAEPARATASTESQAATEKGAAPPDLDKLAAQVYELLSQRLRIERERSRGWNG